MSVLKGEGRVPILFGSMSFAVGSKLHRGYLSRPDLAGEWPTVVVVPSVWGVTPSVKDVCRMLARRGLAAVAVDLYRGEAPDRSAEREVAAAAAGKVPQERALADLADVVRFVTNPAGFWSSAEHGIGVVGLGGGGPLAAAHATDVSAAALALVSSPFDDTLARVLAGFAGGLLALHGRDDEVAPIDAVIEARSHLPHAEVVIYDGVGHDFLDDQRHGYEPEAARDTIERLSVFLAKHLPPPPA